MYRLLIAPARYNALWKHSIANIAKITQNHSWRQILRKSSFCAILYNFMQCLQYFVAGEHDTLAEPYDIVSTNALGRFKHISDNSEFFRVLSRCFHPLRFG